MAVLVACVAAGVRGLNPLLAFGLGGFAAASAGRQLAVSIRRQGWRGVVGPANGGMIVHLGVVAIAVAFAASHSFAQQTQLSLEAGQTARFDGHSFTFVGLENLTASTHTAVAARVRIDGGQIYAPAITSYPFSNEAVLTPSVRTRPSEDLYLTLAATPAKRGDPATIGVKAEPLVMWIWAGGALILGGTLLAAWPERRRRARTANPLGTNPEADAASDGAGPSPDSTAAPVGNPA